MSDAVNAALAAGRPLLVRGEPGIGKSQLARAAAKCLERAYVSHVIDARTEARDLLWHFDAVERLAEAQLCGALHESADPVRERLRVEKYLRPGPLWWAFDWQSATTQAETVRSAPPPQPDGGKPGNGWVVLIDEIDKAETEVPNGLLEALGAGQFAAFGRAEPVVTREPPPLLIITTNEERALPDAFIRRCLVLYLTLPEKDEALTAFLADRGRAHFPEANAEVLRAAARQLAQDRRAARDEKRLPLPGQAEYLDLVRAVLTLRPDAPEKQQRVLETIARFTTQKHSGAG